MKKVLLILVLFVLLPVGSAFAQHPVVEPDQCFIYEGQYKFKFYVEDEKLKANTYGSVDLHRYSYPADIYLYFDCPADNDILKDVEQSEFEVCGISNYTGSGKMSKFWALSTFYSGSTGSPAPEHPNDGQITAIGDFRTRNLDKRIQIRGTGALVAGETLHYFEFKFSGRYVGGGF